MFEEGFVRVKMSWARERLGYLAYCGSEPMVTAFWRRQMWSVKLDSNGRSILAWPTG